MVPRRDERSCCRVRGVAPRLQRFDPVIARRLQCVRDGHIGFAEIDQEIDDHVVFGDDRQRVESRREGAQEGGNVQWERVVTVHEHEIADCRLLIAA